MAAKKTTSANKEIFQKGSGTKTSPLSKVNSVLSLLFYIIWIAVGIFFLVFIYGNIRQGLLKSLFAKPASQEAAQSVQPPTETNLPGIGTVNIECVQNSLSTETIQKIVTDGNMDNLTVEERAKLEPCVVKAEEATESPAP